MQSPAIIKYSWGEIIVEGFPPFKDVKLFPGGARNWDWRETGTGHANGIQPGDVTELLEHGAKIIILSRGVIGRLKVNQRTIQLLEKRGVEIHIHRTVKAIKVYNELRENKLVAALIHSTC